MTAKCHEHCSKSATIENVSVSLVVVGRNGDNQPFKANVFFGSMSNAAIKHIIDDFCDLLPGVIVYSLDDDEHLYQIELSMSKRTSPAEELVSAMRSVLKLHRVDYSVMTLS